MNDIKVMDCKSYILFLFVLFLIVIAGSVSAETFYNVRDYGAVGDGVALDTQALQQAIDVCHNAGEGTVLVPSGTYLSGTIYLKSNIHILLDRGACLFGTKDLSQYLEPPEDCAVYSTGSKQVFLYGEHVENVRIEGQGTIDGNWATYIQDVTGREKRGPLAILFEHSRDIVLDTITVTRSPGWAVTFFDCQRVKILGVKVINCKCDGINPICCQDVLYDGCYIDGTGDDPITIKNEWKIDRHVTRNITIRNTTVKNTTHPGVKIGTGTAGIFENILVENCTFDIRGDFFAIQLMRPNLEQNPERYIDNICFKDITVHHAKRMFEITSMAVSDPIIRNLYFENIQFTGDAAESIIIGLEKAPIRHVTLKNVAVNAKKPGATFLRTQYVNDLVMDNVVLSSENIDSILIAENCSDLKMNHITADHLTNQSAAVRLNSIKNASLDGIRTNPLDVLVFVQGSDSENVTLQDWSGDGVRNPLLGSADVGGAVLQPEAEGIELTALTAPETVVPGKAFSVRVAMKNKGAAGAYKVQLYLADHCVGRQWVWLDSKARQDVDVLCDPVYQPGPCTISIGSLQQEVTVQQTPADIRYGEFCEVEIPAVAGQTAHFMVPVKNYGGTTGTETVELRLDGSVVVRQDVPLKPGEEKCVTLSHVVRDTNSHCWQVGDFPQWPWATYSDVPSRIRIGRDRIIIEAAGGRDSFEHMGALYFNNVEGDFDVQVKCLSQTEYTGEYASIGLVIRNEISDPAAGGTSLHFRVPKYGGYKIWLMDLDGDGKLDTRFGGGDTKFPFWLKYEKRGKTLKAMTSRDCIKWRVCGKAMTIPSQSDVQDVGIYANAFSDDGEMATAVFSELSLTAIHP